jgi:hypothetical protein
MKLSESSYFLLNSLCLSADPSNYIFLFKSLKPPGGAEPGPPNKFPPGVP